MSTYKAKRTLNLYDPSTKKMYQVFAGEVFRFPPSPDKTIVDRLYRGGWIEPAVEEKPRKEPLKSAKDEAKLPKD